VLAQAIDAHADKAMLPGLSADVVALPADTHGGLLGTVRFGALEYLNGYAGVFIVAFLVTLIATPFVRKLAIEMDIVDKPDAARKQHKYPIAYLGGFAVFLGVMAAIAYSYAIVDGPGGSLGPMPLSIVIGIVAITFTGLADDAWGSWWRRRRSPCRTLEPVSRKACLRRSSANPRPCS
jgi:hypothetical protein